MQTKKISMQIGAVNDFLIASKAKVNSVQGIDPVIDDNSYVILSYIKKALTWVICYIN